MTRDEINEELRRMDKIEEAMKFAAARKAEGRRNMNRRNRRIRELIETNNAPGNNPKNFPATT